MTEPLILVINAGSSSLKFSLFEIAAHKELILLVDANIRKKEALKTTVEIHPVDQSEHESYSLQIKKSPLTEMFEFLESLPDLQFKKDQIAAVGHRVVHGGDQSQSQMLTPKLIKEIEKLSILAPLHNPPCLEGIKAAKAALENNVPQFAVFDTSFHRTLPPKASTYGIPLKLAEKYEIKRYGFHGIAHQSLWQIYEQLAGGKKKAANKKVITLQLGSGCSMAAILGGISIDTSMGFTPDEGLLMATRAGDLDVGIVGYLCEKTGESVQNIIKMLNTESGLLGVSGVTGDMKILSTKINKPSVQLAIDLFCYRIIKYIGAYIAVLNGVDALIFSGGIGENDAEIRRNVVDGLNWYGVKLDGKLNEKAKGLEPAEAHKIASKNSSAEVYVIAGNENAFIAKEVVKLLFN